MKSKRTLITALSAGLFLFATHSAEAFYNPSTGRWLSRDPIQEHGGGNLYQFSWNRSIGEFDYLGLFIELWYGNHMVMDDWGIHAYHSKLWLLADDVDLVKTRKYEFKRAFSKTSLAPDSFIGPCQMYGIAIGAGPDYPFDKDEMVAGFNRIRDVLLPLGDPSLVMTFSSAAQALVFLDMVSVRNSTMNGNFLNTTLEYELFPNQTYTGIGWDQFNSNSYVSGLMLSFFPTHPITFPRPTNPVPGFSKPLPSFVFTQAFPSTDALKVEWRRHFSGF
ncbi:MAG: hypothetical protein M9920_16085 [Verrucomicrobiae bacterium]|nr:hypothetical protein [Verrucomicrobiae bacterium]